VMDRLLGIFRNKDVTRITCVYGSFDISFILKLKKIGTVHMMLMVARSRNQCCSGTAAMSYRCIVKIRVTANKGKI